MVLHCRWGPVSRAHMKDKGNTAPFIGLVFGISLDYILGFLVVFPKDFVPGIQGIICNIKDSNHKIPEHKFFW